MFTIKDLHVFLQKEFPESGISYSSVYRSIKSNLHFEFKKLKPSFEKSNNENKKIYCYWFSHAILNEIQRGTLLIAIDEIGISSYKQTIFGWKNDLLYNPRLKEPITGVTNSSVLLACSHEGAIGYYIVEGTIDSIIILDFMQRLLEIVEKNQNPYFF